MHNFLKYKLISFIVLTFLFLSISCTNQEKQNNMDSTCVNKDSIIDENIIIEDTINPNKKFKNAQEALSFMQSSRNWDKYKEGIIVRMVDENLSYAQKLLNNVYKRFIVVDKSTMRVILYDRYGIKEREYGMACGKNYGSKHEKADSRTPEGFFSAEGIYDSTDWLFTDDNGVTSPKKGQFGPRFIRLKTPITSQIGIHGTCSPWSIGHRCSHGCIRIKNENILELVEFVEVGMPIIVNPSRRDIIVNMQEGRNVKWITIDNKPIKAPKPGEIKVINDTIVTDSLSLDEGTIDSTIISVDTTNIRMEEVTNIDSCSNSKTEIINDTISY